MRKHFARAHSLLLALLLCVPTVLTAVATTGAEEGGTAKASFDYDSLYVEHTEGTELVWDAFDKKEGDAVSGLPFTATGTINYKDGYLYAYRNPSQGSSINLSQYLPTYTVGSENYQRDFTVELVMSAPTPTETTENANGFIQNANWQFGALYIPVGRRGKNNEQHTTDGPLASISYVRSSGLTSSSNSFYVNDSTQASNVQLFSTKGGEAFTSTLSFKMTVWRNTRPDGG